ncbi:hypothetical protein HW132_27565 [Brasilonema sp. CT11]|nr:hypothetical protein [Brasilonema sp. CT11]
MKLKKTFRSLSPFGQGRGQRSQCGGEAALREGFPPQVTAERVPRHKASGVAEGRREEKVSRYALMPCPIG